MINKGVLESRTGGTTINYPSTGLLAYYKLDELSGSVINTVGTGNGTNFGATTGVIGKKGLAYSFDGVNDYVNTNLNLLGGKSAFTIAFWFKNLETATALNVFFGQYNTGSQKIYIGTFFGNLRVITYTTAQAGGTIFPFTDTSNFHLLIITYNGEQILSTLDNVNSATVYNQTGAINNINPLSEQIGNDGRTNYGKAIIDEVAVWDRAISIDEKTLLWNSGAGITYTL